MAINPAHYNKVQKIIDEALRKFRGDISQDDPPIGISDVMYVYKALKEAKLLCEPGICNGHKYYEDEYVKIT